MDLEHSNLYAVIMAGGRGERFWPLSRENMPKQMLSLLGGASLIEQTVTRLDGLVPAANIIIVTNEKYVDRLRSLLPQLAPENIIGEPVARDTAPCVALAAAVVRARSGGEEAVMMLLPADHCITGIRAFQQNLADCCRLAAAGGNIVTIGIPPTGPSCDYGYIKAAAPIADSGPTRFAEVERFVEKPDLATAETMLAEGGYSWNAGIFVWKTATVLNAMRRCAPDLAGLADILGDAWRRGVFPETLKREFGGCRKISIDYAVMEKAENILVAEASFEWDDIGNWSALRNHLPADGAGNVRSGLVEVLDCRDAIIYSGESGHLVAAVDLDDVVIVHTSDATLVCRAGSSAHLKELLKRLRNEEGKADFL